MPTADSHPRGAPGDEGRQQSVVTIGGVTLDIFAHIEGRGSAASFTHAPEGPGREVGDECSRPSVRGSAREESRSVRRDASTVRSGSFSFTGGEKVTLHSVLERYGGGGANTAVGFARLGLPVGTLALVGGDAWGERILGNLRREGVGTEGMSVIQDEVSSFSVILLVEGGERVVLYSPGVAGHLCDPLFDRERVRAAAWVVLTRLANEGCRVLDDLLDVLDRHPEMRLTWNPGGSQVREGLRSPLLRRLAARSRVIHLNEEELLLFTGSSTLAEGLNVVRGIGGPIACITRGSRGAVAASPSQAWACPVLPAQTVDSTGAGDAFHVGFSWGVMQGEDLPTCLRAGTLQSSSVIASIGTQPGLLTNNEMRTRLRAIRLPVTPFPLS